MYKTIQKLYVCVLDREWNKKNGLDVIYHYSILHGYIKEMDSRCMYECMSLTLTDLQKKSE